MQRTECLPVALAAVPSVRAKVANVSRVRRDSGDANLSFPSLLSFRERNAVFARRALLKAAEPDDESTAPENEEGS